MKQLEPILKYHFWILLGVALLMAFSGWWLTTDQMQAAITARKETINKKEGLIPKGAVPGTDWASKLKAINEQQERLVGETRNTLYARQKERMIWPAVIREHASSLKYRADFPNIIHRINYRDNYNKEVERVYAIPRPITASDPDGVVTFPISAMPHRVWGNHTPTSKQMWDSMEDLWLLEPILQAVLEVNGGPEATQFDASILVIERLKLHGGDRSKIGQTGETGGGGGGGGGGTTGMPGGMPAGFGGGVVKEGGGGGASQGGGETGSLDVNPIEVFGDPGAVAATADAAAGPGGPGGMPGPGKFDGVADQKPAGEESGRRYIDDDPAMPYRTRGFTLTVVMDHRKVPELYGQLTSSERSPWPIQIVRMHVGRLSDAGGVRGEMPAMGGGIGEQRSGFDEAAGGPAAALLGGPKGGAFRGPVAGHEDEPGNLRQDKPVVNMMDNPFLARVTVAGIITLYNEPEIKDAPVPAASSAEAAPTAASTDGEAAPAAAGENGAAAPEMTDEESAESPGNKSELDVDEEAMSEEEDKPDTKTAPESADSDSSEKMPDKGETTDEDEEDSAESVKKPSSSKSGK